jgi:hypothetical protein
MISAKSPPQSILLPSSVPVAPMQSNATIMEL